VEREGETMAATLNGASTAKPNPAERRRPIAEEEKEADGERDGRFKKEGPREDCGGEHGIAVPLCKGEKGRIRAQTRRTKGKPGKR
jgi:hypothetical protein